MPQSGYEKANPQIKIHPGSGDSVAPHGNIEIIPDPRRQRNMPTPPKFSKILRYIGHMEIFHNPES